MTEQLLPLLPSRSAPHRRQLTLASMLTLEVCVADIESVVAVEVVAATTTDIQLRLEVCSALEVGGLTPTLAMLDPPTTVVDDAITHMPSNLQRQILIRPRAGDFCYSELEQQQMQRDMHHITTHMQTWPQLFGGFVVGGLNADYGVDADMMDLFLGAFSECTFTFHRAIDQCDDILEATRVLIHLHLHHPNLKYILTSGGAESAEQGVKTIKQMQQMCASTPNCSLQVMAAAGISERNIATIIDQSGVAYVHGSFREQRSVKTIESLSPVLTEAEMADNVAALQLQHFNNQHRQTVRMGASDSADRFVTSVDKLQAVISSMRRSQYSQR